MAWLTGLRPWAKRKSFTLSRASGAVTAYQLKLLVGESSGLYDFTTFTEVDAGGRISVAANAITATAIPRNEDDYVYKDMGAGSIGDFVHYVDFKYTNMDATSLLGVWGVGNQINDLTGWTNALGLYHYNGTMAMKDFANTNAVTLFSPTANVQYYATIIRSGSTATVTIYSDSARTVGVSSGSIVCTTTTYRYLYGCISYNDGSAGLNTSAIISNLSLTTGQLATGCKTDFSDLRFTTADGTTLLDYYIEDVRGSTPYQVATIWIEFDSIGTGATTFYMYYGYSSATAVSSGSNTFVFFEDFNSLNDGDLQGQNSWASGGAGSADIDVTAAVKYEGAKGSQSANGATNVSVKKTIPGTIYNYILQIRMRASLVSPANGSDVYLREAGSQITAVSISGSQMTALIAPGSWTNIGKAVVADVWYKAAISVNSTTAHSTWVDDVKYTPASETNYTTVTSKIDEIMLEHYTAGGTVYWDQILICKYYTTGPAWGSFGAEEAAVLNSPFPFPRLIQ